MDNLDRCPFCDEKIKIYRDLNLGQPEPPFWLVDNALIRVTKLAVHLRLVHGAKLPEERAQTDEALSSKNLSNL